MYLIKINFNVNLAKKKRNAMCKNAKYTVLPKYETKNWSPPAGAERHALPNRSSEM